MKRVIVTGATSNIAISLINKLIREKYYVYAVIRPDTKNRYKIPQNDKISVLDIDMEEISKLGDYNIRACAIYHFAWEGIRGEERNNSYLQAKSSAAAKRCMELSVKMNIPFFIGIGSQAEYGVTKDLITEDTELKPLSEYGKKKAEAYNYGVQLYQDSSYTFIWARIFSAFGQEDNRDTLLMQCIQKMKLNQPVNLSPCEHLWDYTYVDDVAEALLLLLDKKVKSGAYNISYGKSRKLKEYIIQMKKLLHSDSILNFGAIPYIEDTVVQMNPDVSKLVTATDWKPEVDFIEGISRVLKG